jgi:hypothetical protein
VDELAERFRVFSTSMRTDPSGEGHTAQFIPAKLLSYMAGIEFWIGAVFRRATY